MRAKNALDAEKRRNQRLENTIEELQRKVEAENRDSMVLFIENELYLTSQTQQYTPLSSSQVPFSVQSATIDALGHMD